MLTWQLLPLVFGTNGGMGIERQIFVKQLAVKLAEKDQEGYCVVIAWLRTRLSFEILRAVHVSVIGVLGYPFIENNVKLWTILV